MTHPVLSIEGLNLNVVDRPVLTDVSFELPPCGITALMGPMGVGKSSLLKWLCGKADPSIFHGSCRRADYFYAPLGGRNRPRLFTQFQADTVESTMAQINTHLRTNPAVLCIDEITARLSDDDTKLVLHRLSIMANSRSLLIVSHNQAHMERYSDTVMLLAGGILREITPTEEFFKKPRSEAGRQFVGTGSVAIPSAGTPSRHLRSDLRETPAGVSLNVNAVQNTLQTVVDNKLFVYAAAEDEQSGSVNTAALLEQGVNSVVIFGCMEASMMEELEQKGLNVILSTPPADKSSMTAWLARCRDLQSHLDAEEKMAVITRPNDPNGVLSIVMQLVFMGLTAQRATEVLSQLSGVDSINPEDEQFLWDLELALDLENDGVDPSVLENQEKPDISWIEEQEVKFRQQSGDEDDDPSRLTA